MNLYAYVRGDPLNGTDPSGLAATGNDYRGRVFPIDFRPLGSTVDVSQVVVTGKRPTQLENLVGVVQPLPDRMTVASYESGGGSGDTPLSNIRVAANLVGSMGCSHPIDPPPFLWLQIATSQGALLVAALILTTQRREGKLADNRAQWILELSMYNDQKISKILELLEESQRDNAAILDRIDNQAEAMSTPSNTEAVLEAIKELRDDLF